MEVNSPHFDVRFAFGSRHQTVHSKSCPGGRISDGSPDGSCIRLKPEYRNHVWSFDFVEAQTHDGRRLRLMTLIDEFTHKCLAILVARRINAIGVVEALADAKSFGGVPAYIRSDDAPEMIAKVFRQRLARLCTKSLYIEPGSP